MASDPQPERHEPLPSVAQLPGWIWRRTGRGLRILIACLLLGGVVLTLVLASDIGQTKREEADTQRRQDAEARAQRVRELRAEQRPRLGAFESVAPPGANAAMRLEVRAEQIDELAGAIAADARRRVRAGALDGADTARGLPAASSGGRERGSPRESLAPGRPLFVHRDHIRVRRDR